MKIGQLVRYPKNCEQPVPAILGVITSLNPFNDNQHTEIFWLDSEEEAGSITSVWVNEDFEVTNFQDEGVKAFIDELETSTDITDFRRLSSESEGLPL